jgi:signal transduction histidine kinase
VTISRGLSGLAFLMLGAALAVAFALLAIGLVSPFMSGDSGWTATAVVAIVLLGAALVVVVGAVPAVRRIEGVAVESMLDVSFEGGSPQAAARAADRLRCVAWLAAHLLAGAGLVAAAVTLPALGLEVAGWLTVPAFAAAVAIGLLLVVGLRRLAPPLLGLSPHERIARLEGETRELGRRNRIAREIHDSIGHALSLVTVQATTARRVQHDDPDYVDEALASIEDAARRAAAELDHVLGLLRDEQPDRVPVPGLTSMPDLVSAAARAGLATTYDCSVDAGDLEALSTVTSRELYRIAQEALANAIRHGASPCTVTLSRTGREVTLEVTNALNARRPPGGRRGHGLRGMDERARAVGGSATVAADADVWSVRVALPWVGTT